MLSGLKLDGDDDDDEGRGWWTMNGLGSVKVNVR